MSRHYLTEDERTYGFIEDEEVISSLDPERAVVVHVLDNLGNELDQYGEHSKVLIHVHRSNQNRLDGLTRAYAALDCTRPINISHNGNNHLTIQGSRNQDFVPVSPEDVADMIQQMINPSC